MKKLRIILTILLAAVILVPLGIRVYRQYHRRRELLDAGYYRLYYSYVKRDDEYRAFYMVNAVDADTLAASVKKLMSDSFLAELREHEDYAAFGEKPIVVHFLLPSEELPYGWEKSDANISANFDLSAFYRHTALRVTVPVGAGSFAECICE